MLNTISIEDEDTNDVRVKARQPTALDRQIGSMLRIQRASRRISQESLAEMLGISFQMIQKLEQGKNRLTLSRFILIAKFVGFDTFSFLNDLPSGGDEPGANIVDGIKQKLGVRGSIELLDIYVGMKHGDRPLLLALARRLSGASSEGSDDE